MTSSQQLSSSLPLSLDTLTNNPSHDAYYFVDTNIISAYVKDEIPTLNQYVNEMSSRGSHFFVTERIAGEFARTGCALPPQFIVYENNDADIRAEFAYKDVMTKFDVRTPEFDVDVRWLLECGHCLHSCEDIPLVKLLTPGSAFALTLNAKLVHRFLRSKDHRRS